MYCVFCIIVKTTDRQNGGFRFVQIDQLPALENM